MAAWYQMFSNVQKMRLERLPDYKKWIFSEMWKVFGKSLFVYTSIYETSYKYDLFQEEEEKHRVPPYVCSEEKIKEKVEELNIQKLAYCSLFVLSIIISIKSLLSQVELSWNISMLDIIFLLNNIFVSFNWNCLYIITISTWLKFSILETKTFSIWW